MENINANTEQQPATPTPEAEGGQGEKLFTQDDVNRIVSERLARERTKGEPAAIDAREAALSARENRLACRDFLEDLSKNGKAASGVLGLLDVLDTADAGRFQGTVKALLELGAFNPQLEPLVLHKADYRGQDTDPIAAIFKPKL